MIISHTQKHALMRTLTFTPIALALFFSGCANPPKRVANPVKQFIYQCDYSGKTLISRTRSDGTIQLEYFDRFIELEPSASSNLYSNAHLTWLINANIGELKSVEQSGRIGRKIDRCKLQKNTP